jgi:flavin-dependent dehydrogenase
VSEQRVVVVGGGTAGAATALALQRAGVPTTIVEQSGRPGWKIGEGLPPAANPLLQRLDVWDRFQADGHLPSYGNASAWGSADLVDYSFIFDPHGAGWHLDRPRFDALLLQMAQERGAALLRGTATVHEHSRSGGDLWLRIVSDGGDETLARAPFVVDASGRTASLARWYQARREHLDRLVGVVGVMATRDPAGDLDARTIVEAVEDGWWYSAPVPGGRLVVAFMTDGDVVQRRRAGRLDGWSSLLGETVHTCARVVRLECRPLALPCVVLANGSRLAEVAGPTWLAVGDAALAHDPLSSQGMASALLLGLSAADAIRGHLNGQGDALEPYRALARRLSDEYVHGLAYYYGQERRWPGSPFWARRGTDHLPAGYPRSRRAGRQTHV